MKRFVLFALLLTIFFDSFAIDYYSKVSGSPSVLANWNTLPGGTGTAPPAGSFTAAGNKFIIQNGHTMSTTANWTIGSATSTLQIESGGILQGNHPHLIQLTGTFRIDDGGKYIHDNFLTVSSAVGASIWGGTESFAANSTIEIIDWVDNTTPLPVVSWGNLIINVTTPIGGHWSQDGNLSTIQGDLHVILTGTGTNEFRFTTNVNTTVTIGGNLIVDGGILNIKSGTMAGRFCNVQVNGNITVNGGTLNTGNADAIPNAELRFKGDFTAAAGATITSTDNNSYLVANGTFPQTLSCTPTMNCSFRVASGAIVNLASALTTSGVSKIFAVLGTFNQNNFAMNMSGAVEAAGGVFNSVGSLTIGVGCRACTGDGTYNTSTWCTTSGNYGSANFISSTVSLNLAVSTTFLTAGHLTISSAGEINFYNSTATTINTPSAFNAGYIVRPGSNFSLDETSYISGTQSSYLGMGGTLRIGSVDGITSSGNTGNVRTPTRTYNSSGTNNFEYFGSNPQVTGNGLPTTIAGILRINNSSALSSLGVTLTNSTTINGFLDMDLGKLRTSATSLISISSIGNFSSYGPDSFIGGPLQVTGHNGFTFPIGINAASAPTGTIYAPIVMNYIVGPTNSTDSYTAEYIRGNPQTAIAGNTVEAPIDHISYVEYWSFFRTDGGSNTPTKQIVLEVNPESICYNLNTLLVARHDGSQWRNEGNVSVIPLGSSPPLVWGKLFSNTSTNISGYFTLATTDVFADNPLPISLLSFDVTKLSNTKATINWELAACCSAAAKFEIQRAGTDKSFVTIGRIGGSETNKLYNYLDNGLKNGINYYRLKMIDADGKIAYSRIVAVMNGVNGLVLTSLIPTVITNSASLTIASSKEQKLDIVIVDMQGRVMLKNNYMIVAGNSNIELPLGGLASGVYQLTGVTVEGKTNTIRFIRQ